MITIKQITDIFGPITGSSIEHFDGGIFYTFKLKSGHSLYISEWVPIELVDTFDASLWWPGSSAKRESHSGSCLQEVLNNLYQFIKPVAI